MAVPMANDPPFATLNHFAADLGIPSESDLLRIGISRCTSAHVISSMRLHTKSSGTFSEADPVRGRQVVRAEPMSTLDAELNDFGAQLAMLGGHAADRDG